MELSSLSPKNDKEPIVFKNFGFRSFIQESKGFQSAFLDGTSKYWLFEREDVSRLLFLGRVVEGLKRSYIRRWCRKR
jgi:hypothetical protein